MKNPFKLYDITDVLLYCEGLGYRTADSSGEPEKIVMIKDKKGEYYCDIGFENKDSTEQNAKGHVSYNMIGFQHQASDFGSQSIPNAKLIPDCAFARDFAKTWQKFLKFIEHGDEKSIQKLLNEEAEFKSQSFRETLKTLYTNSKLEPGIVAEIEEGLDLICIPPENPHNQDKERSSIQLCNYLVQAGDLDTIKKALCIKPIANFLIRRPETSFHDQVNGSLASRLGRYYGTDISLLSYLSRDQERKYFHDNEDQTLREMFEYDDPPSEKIYELANELPEIIKSSNNRTLPPEFILYKALLMLSKASDTDNNQALAANTENSQLLREAFTSVLCVLTKASMQKNTGNETEFDDHTTLQKRSLARMIVYMFMLALDDKNFVHLLQNDLASETAEKMPSGKTFKNEIMDKICEQCDFGLIMNRLQECYERAEKDGDKATQSNALDLADEIWQKMQSNDKKRKSALDYLGHVTPYFLYNTLFDIAPKDALPILQTSMAHYEEDHDIQRLAFIKEVVFNHMFRADVNEKIMKDISLKNGYTALVDKLYLGLVKDKEEPDSDALQLVQAYASDAVQKQIEAAEQKPKAASSASKPKF